MQQLREEKGVLKRGCTTPLELPRKARPVWETRCDKEATFATNWIAKSARDM